MMAETTMTPQNPRKLLNTLNRAIVPGLLAFGLRAGVQRCSGDIYGIPGGPLALCTGITVEISGTNACGLFQDSRFDYVVFNARPLPGLTSHTSLSVAVWFPSCVAPISNATYIDDGGVIPAAISISHELESDCTATDPEARFWFAQFTFDPPVTLGHSTAKLVLTVPKGYLRGFGMLTLRANDPAPNPHSEYTTCAVYLSSDGCISDFNCDGARDLFDYLDFVEMFGAATDRADFNRDGAVDLFDYLDFVEAFNSGC